MNVFQIQLRAEEPQLVRAIIQSRHVGATTYVVWVQFNEEGQTAEEKIPAWLCSCPTGQRTIGCCSHICSVVWYLSYARHSDWEPSNPDWGKHLIDPKEIVTMSDEESADSDDNV